MQGGCGGNGGLTKVMAMDARLLALVETDTYGGRPGRGGNGGRGGSGVRLFFDSSVTHTHRQLIHITNTQGPGGAGGRKGKRKDHQIFLDLVSAHRASVASEVSERHKIPFIYV